MASGIPARTRIALVYPASDSAHGMIFAKRLAYGLRERNADVLEFRLSSRTNPWALRGEAARFRRFLNEAGPCVVHAHYGTVTAAFCALLSNSPLVITYCGSDLNPCPSSNYFRWLTGYWLSQFAALRARTVICVSEGLRRRLWWRAADAVVLPNGIDTDRFRPMSRSDARERLKWGEEPVVLFNAGKSPRVKRADLAEAAFKEISKRRSDSILHVLNGDTDPELIPIIMNAADCLLFTSDYEGSPNVVKEAAACGLPVVSVPVGDVEETLRGIDPSFIVERRPLELADAVVSVLDGRRRSNGSGHVGRFSLEHQDDVLLSVYAAAAGTSIGNSGTREVPAESAK